MVKRSIMTKLLDTLQLCINRCYEKDGLTDKVLDMQVRLNTLRAKYDIPDSKEIIDEQGFVQ